MRITRVVVHDSPPPITYYVATSRSTPHRGVGLTPRSARVDLARKRADGVLWMEKGRYRWR